MYKIAFDIDGCLLQGYTTRQKGSQVRPIEYCRHEIRDMLIALSEYNEITVWSGGGKEYAEMVVKDLGLERYVTNIMSKLQNPGDIDISFDDMEVNLAKINIRV